MQIEPIVQRIIDGRDVGANAALLEGNRLEAIAYLLTLLDGSRKFTYAEGVVATGAGEAARGSVSWNPGRGGEGDRGGREANAGMNVR